MVDQFPLYDSRFVTHERFQKHKADYIREGDWEYIVRPGGVYLRKWISGQRSTVEGWSVVR